MRWWKGLAVIAVLAGQGACSSAADRAAGQGAEATGASPLDAGPTGTDAGSALDAPAPDGASAADASDGRAHAPDGSDAQAPPPVDASTPDASYAGAWRSVSYGVTALDTGGGPDIAIAYGGYTATDADSQAWLVQMTKVRLAQLGVGHLFAVRGPRDPDYASREIGNSELAAVLATEAAASSRVLVLAHSSGGFVADELFTFVGATVMAKMTYFNLDGGSWALTTAMVGRMRGVYFCQAHDAAAGYSENASSDRQLHADFAGSHLFTVDADGSGCDVGAGWCLHDTLITSRPHDPATYDLAHDYTDFTGGRQVVTSYVDQAVADGAL